MTASITDKLFFQHVDPDTVSKIVKNALSSVDDGELFLEYRQSESISLDDGKIKSASFDTTQGFGLRAVCEDLTSYAQSTTLSEESLKRASKTVQSVCSGYQGTVDLSPAKTNQQFYPDLNPLSTLQFQDKIDLLHEIDSFARQKDHRVHQVMANISGSWQAVRIIRADGTHAVDIRPLVRLNVSVVMQDKGRSETGGHGSGGRMTYESLVKPENWQLSVEKAIRQAKINLDSIPAPAGEMTVVLGSGWPGVLLHEAIGHGLEGDFNRKGTSAFSGRIGERVASKGVTVVDDGTLPNRRGSLTIDDEGTPSSRTILIEEGILTGYLFDRLNARLMKQKSTGNGRRQSFGHQPMPRMTNTFMLNGEHHPEDIISSVKNGLYAVDFGGGQVDITSGKFVFSATEAYLIENGKITRPVKGATLIGNGPDVLTRVAMIGNDMKLDDGIGTCGKDGQSVPVGNGQATLRIDGLTVGGTALGD
jgi:TldD protein